MHHQGVSWIHTFDRADGRTVTYFPINRDASRRRFSAARWLCLTSRMNKANARSAAQTQAPMMVIPMIPSKATCF